MMRCVIVGAGRTGRGFLARLLAGHARIALIDSDRALVERLNERGAYAIRYFDGAPETGITGYEAYHTDDARCAAVLSESDVVLVCVRGENDPEAGAWLEARLAGEKCVIACENAVVPAELLEGELQRTAASGAIFCTTIEDGPLDILSESYPALHVSARGIPEDFAKLPGIIVEPDFDTLMLRKIYTYNAASAIIAYLGWAYGFESYPEAANDRRIEERLDRFYRAIDGAICAEFTIDPEAQRRFSAFSKLKFQNPAIADSVARNAASPERKLAASERIIAPMRLIEKHGGDAGPLIETAAAAIKYSGIHDAENAARMLQSLCGLAEGEDLFIRILEAFFG